MVRRHVLHTLSGKMKKVTHEDGREEEDPPVGEGGEGDLVTKPDANAGVVLVVVGDERGCDDCSDERGDCQGDEEDGVASPDCAGSVDHLECFEVSRV